MKRNDSAHIPGYTHIRTKKGISEYKLKKNGLRVLHKRLRGIKTVTAGIVYLVGSRHEERGETGITHMLEHMMFKQTGSDTKVDSTLGWKELENAGAVIEASTWMDRTHFSFTLPARYLKDILAVEARRMRNIILTEGELAPERANVLSEYEMYAGDPLSMLEASVVGTAYHAHTYGHDTIGHKPDIKNYTVAKLKQHHDRFYWPNNACVLVIGDVEKEAALTEVKKAFTDIPRSPEVIPTVSIPEPEQLGERKVMVEQQSPINIISINYKNVSGHHPDWMPLYLLLAYLADGASSTLHKKLVDQHKASSVCPYQFPTHDPFLCGIIAYISKGSSHEEVERVILREIEHCKKRPIAQKTLATIKNKIKASELFGRDGSNAIASALTEYVAMGDWTKYDTLLNELEKVTAHDIMRVAQTYCVATRKTTGLFIGSREARPLGERHS